MTPTIKSFTSTSTAPYDRHYYTIANALSDNVNEHTFHDYEQLRAWWWQQGITEGLTVNVMDYKHTKRTSGGQGF